MYELHTDYGCGSFKNEDDAIMALLILAPYHDIEINITKVKEALERNAYYEKFPLAIIRGE